MGSLLKTRLLRHLARTRRRSRVNNEREREGLLPRPCLPETRERVRRPGTDPRPETESRAGGQRRRAGDWCRTGREPAALRSLARDEALRARAQPIDGSSGGGAEPVSRYGGRVPRPAW